MGDIDAPRVLNKYKDVIPRNAVYIGRPTSNWQGWNPSRSRCEVHAHGSRMPISIRLNYAGKV